MLNSGQLGDSPFYPGKTTYGGASAVRSSCNRPGTPYQVIYFRFMLETTFDLQKTTVKYSSSLVVSDSIVMLECFTSILRLNKHVWCVGSSKKTDQGQACWCSTLWCDQCHCQTYPAVLRAHVKPTSCEFIDAYYTLF